MFTLLFIFTEGDENKSSGVKRPVREADHSSPFNAEVKNAWSYTSTPPYDMAWCLVKLRVMAHPQQLRTVAASGK
jgi:hypothetical protein